MCACNKCCSYDLWLKFRQLWPAFLLVWIGWISNFDTLQYNTESLSNIDEYWSLFAIVFGIAYLRKANYCISIMECSLSTAHQIQQDKEGMRVKGKQRVSELLSEKGKERLCVLIVFIDLCVYSFPSINSTLTKTRCFCNRISISFI